MDAAGLGVLVSLNTSMQRYGRRLVLLCLAPHIDKLLKEAEIEGFFAATCESEEEELKGAFYSRSLDHAQKQFLIPAFWEIVMRHIILGITSIPILTISGPSLAAVWATMTGRTFTAWAMPRMLFRANPGRNRSP